MNEKTLNEISVDDNTTAGFTRRRLDLYFLPGFILGLIVGIVCAIISGQAKFIIIPFGILAIWLAMRFDFPKEGYRTKTIHSAIKTFCATPGAIQILLYWAVVILIFIVLFVYDLFVRDVPWNGSPQWYHWIAGAFFSVFLGVGAWFIERHYRLKMEKTVTVSEKSNSIDDNDLKNWS